MSFKIGFTANTESDQQRKVDTITAQNIETPAAKKSVVDVYFADRHLTCSYYNDMFDLKRGDFVYVEGKLEGLRGRVVEVNYNFKIKLSDYKRVIGVADTDVIGEFHLAGSHFITVDGGALPYNQVITWFKAPTSEEEDVVSGTDDEIFNLAHLGDMKIDPEKADRGHDYYMENRVAYIELNAGKGRAIVTGKKTYDVEFNYNHKTGDISGLVCNCFCSGACKHEFATMLQLRDIFAIIEKEYPSFDPDDYLAAIVKSTFFEYVIDTKTKGTFTMG